MNISPLFSTDKFPVLLTILFALAGWSLTHIVDRLVQSPIIEYAVSEDHTGGVNRYVLTLTNISNNKLFKNIRFDWMIPDSSHAYFIQEKSSLQPLPPMEQSYKEETLPRQISFSLQDFHPQGKMILTAELSGNVVPMLLFASIASVDTPADIVAATEPVLLMQSSFETFLVKHEISIVLTLLIIWIVLIVLYLFLLGKNSQPSGPAQQEVPGHA